MGKNIFQIEADNIRGFLERHGYIVEQRPDHIIVKDPVLIFNGKGTERTEYTDVVIRSFDDAINFVATRS